MTSKLKMMSKKDIISRWQRSGVIPETIKAIKNNPELHYGVVRAWEFLKQDIKDLPFEQQVAICLHAVQFNADTMRRYQQESKEFSDNLKNDRHE